MRVLVACEYSGRVREAFRKRGHDAISCDLLESEDGSASHIIGDVLSVLESGWDLVIAHPPCTRLCVSGNRWRKQFPKETDEASDFFLRFTRLGCKWAIENPIGIMSSRFRKPDQIVQPWQYGHGETKATCLWLNDLPKLSPTKVVAGRAPTCHWAAPGPNRWKERSRTYQGIADAMAEQWG